MAFRQTLPNGKTVEFQSPPTEADIFEAYTQTNGNLEGYGGEQVIKDIDSSLATATAPRQMGSPDNEFPMLVNRKTGEEKFASELDAIKARQKYSQASKDILNTLPPEQQISAWAIAKDIVGTRQADKFVDTVAAGLASGMSRDEIEDKLRFSRQSETFNKDFRKAAQHMTIGQSVATREATYDALDDYGDDVEGAKGYLKRMAIEKASSNQKNVIMGKERTIEFLNEIKGDLESLEAQGIPSGFFRGNYENILSKVGQVQNPEMRKVATKIATAMMNYRRDMTGVQFTEKESKEYKRIFPDINKVGDFNAANISGLNESFSGDVERFYKQSMGEGNYKKIFGGSETKTEKKTITLPSGKTIEIGG
jgi:hypothetical protein